MGKYKSPASLFIYFLIRTPLMLKTMSTGVTSDTEEEIQLKEENVHLLQRTLKEMDDRLVTLSKNLNQCESVINDLMALKHVLESKSLQDVCYQN